ncbi:DUF6221 family protein [Streptomyces microflavus]|uniref:DUF6221 family protein n=1 Tax=Streptomyces microflavus TaxID=1919 RepID=UPI0033ADC817
MTDALVAFLKARLDDDEHWALTVSLESRPETWEPDHENGAVLTVAGKQVATGTRHSINDLEHIARQDPARTLREVEAARAVIGLYEEAGDRMDRAMSDGDTITYQEARIEQRTLRKVLLREAAVHEAHPDYLEEWRP